MTENVYIELFNRFIKTPVLRLTRLSGQSSKTLLTFLWNKYLQLAKIIPGADVIFLGIFLKEIKLYVLHPVLVNDTCGSMFVSWIYDLYVTYLIVTGFVIYLTRRFILTRKSS